MDHTRLGNAMGGHRDRAPGIPADMDVTGVEHIACLEFFGCLRQGIRQGFTLPVNGRCSFPGAFRYDGSPLFVSRSFRTCRRNDLFAIDDQVDFTTRDLVDLDRLLTRGEGDFPRMNRAVVTDGSADEVGEVGGDVPLVDDPAATPREGELVIQEITVGELHGRGDQAVNINPGGRREKNAVGIDQEDVSIRLHQAGDRARASPDDPVQDGGGAGRLLKANRLVSRDVKSLVINDRLAGILDHPEFVAVSLKVDGSIGDLFTLGQSPQAPRKGKDRNQDGRQAPTDIHSTG